MEVAQLCSKICPLREGSLQVHGVGQRWLHLKAVQGHPRLPVRLRLLKSHFS